MRTATVRATPPRLIPFSDSMVDAIREGRKTQTRRHVGKALPSWATSFESTPEGVLARGRLNNKPISKLIPCRYGKPGDRLAVREALARVDGLAHYAADGRPVIDVDSLDGTVPWKWKTSRLGAMYMPRHAVRTFLEITEVRIERLTKISEADAMAEGCTKVRDSCYVFRGVGYDTVGLCHSSPEVAYACLWDEINGRGSWSVNPYVFAITFRVLEVPKT